MWMHARHQDLSEFFDVWNRVISTIPDAKRLALHEMGKSIMVDVEAQIVEQGVNDDNYHVRDWQVPRVGGNLGYVAVRPLNKVLRDAHGRRIKATTRQITKYLERGHGVRSPSGTAKRRYVPRIERAGIGTKGNVYVKGYLFYRWAQNTAEWRAVKAAERNVLVPLENAFDL